ncbi:MAG: phosphatase PAP2 family protein [Gemmatimonadota bacterium]
MPSRTPTGHAVLAAYLTAALVPLLGMGPSTLRATLALGHVLAVVVLLRPGPGDAGPLVERVHRWLPLILIPLLYAELPLLNQWVSPEVRDPLVLRWEAWAFPGNPALTLGGRWPWPVLSELLHLSYLSFYFMLIVPVLSLEFRGDQRAFDETMAALLLSVVLAFVCFWLLPVEGPRYRFPPPAGIPDGPVRALVLAILEGGSSRGTAFPSSHASVAVAQTLLALRHQPRLGAVLAVATVGLCFGAVYGGFHYAVDMLAGVILGILAAGVVMACSPRGVAGGGSPF